MNGTVINEFVRSYTRAVEDGNAAIFAGAGLSKPAGCVNWKELLRQIAEDLGLDVDKETDLVAVAQYHVNENMSRGRVNQVLIDEFNREIAITENHKILSGLNIGTFWTTNYDSLIEDTLRHVGKRVDVKKTMQNLATSISKSDAVVYKMHGDKDLPHEAVLTKDDYEGYNLKRQLFTTVLQGDLVSKTFLFIGFSFDDPNLEYILSRIRILLGENQRNHYCFMKEVSRGEFNSDEEFLYAKVKQELRVRDLKRYSIKVVLIDDYSVITTILKRIENFFIRKNIFISGSADHYGQWGEKKVFQFASSISKSIIKIDGNIVTGFGLGVGSCVISGALEEIYQNYNHGRAEERLKVRPFPQQSSGDIPLKQLWTQYRTDMISSVGLAIFIFGNKTGDNNAIIEANGMLEEFQIAVENKVVPIPIGMTGFAAKTIWNIVMSDFDSYVPNNSLKPLYEVIGDESQKEEEVLDAVNNIILALRNQ